MAADNLQAVWPWRKNTDPHLLIDGVSYYEHMLAAIQKASRQVDIETYLMSSGTVSDRFIDALTVACERGITVRLLLDAVGSSGLVHRDVDRIIRAGINLRFFNPITSTKYLKNLARDHRKIICIDQQIVYVGGAGISDHFISVKESGLGWRDNMVCLQGPIVADWQALFERCWQHFDDMHRTSWRAKIRSTLQAKTDPPAFIGAQPMGRVITSRGLGNKAILSSLIHQIKQSQQRIWISTAYFYPSRATVRALTQAAENGIDVMLLLPGPITDHPSVRYAGRGWYHKLLKANVKIYEYQPRFLHQKVALIDSWVSMGSCNFDRWNLRWNLEANVELISSEFAQSVYTMLIKDRAQANGLDYTSWKHRPWRDKLKERFWQFIARFLDLIENH